MSAVPMPQSRERTHTRTKSSPIEGRMAGVKAGGEEDEKGRVRLEVAWAMERAMPIVTAVVFALLLLLVLALLCLRLIMLLHLLLLLVRYRVRVRVAVCVRQ